MDHKRRTGMVFGVLIILLGVWMLLDQVLPGYYWARFTHLFGVYSWPMIVIGVGVFLLFLGGILGVPELAIPACIVGGIGGLLWWQNATGHWESWAYTWALIPGFVGCGIILAGLLRGQGKKAIQAGGGLVLISLVLFAVFSSFLGGSQLFSPYWPVILIALGVWMLVSRMIRR